MQIFNSLESLNTHVIFDIELIPNQFKEITDIVDYFYTKVKQLTQEKVKRDYEAKYSFLATPQFHSAEINLRDELDDARLDYDFLDPITARLQKGIKPLRKKNLSKWDKIEEDTPRARIMSYFDFIQKEELSSQKLNELIKIPALRVPSQRILTEKKFSIISIDSPYEPVIVKKVKTDHASTDLRDNSSPIPIICFPKKSEFSNQKDVIEKEFVRKLNFYNSLTKHNSSNIDLQLSGSYYPRNNKVEYLNQFSQLIQSQLEEKNLSQILSGQTKENIPKQQIIQKLILFFETVLNDYDSNFILLVMFKKKQNGKTNLRKNPK